MIGRGQGRFPGDSLLEDCRRDWHGNWSLTTTIIKYCNFPMFHLESIQLPRPPALIMQAIRHQNIIARRHESETSANQVDDKPLAPKEAASAPWKASVNGGGSAKGRIPVRANLFPAAVARGPHYSGPTGNWNDHWGGLKPGKRQP